MSITIVVPCYNEQESLPLYYPEYVKLKAEIPEELELILVNDGSKDGTLAIMKQLAKQDPSVKYVSFSRNFGKEAAIYAGLQASTGDYVSVMDADLQHPPRLLPEMYRSIKEEGYDSVATRRVSRKGEPPIRSWFARKFYKLMNRISKTELVDGAQDYRLMTRQFVEAVLSCGEYNRFSKGLFGWVGFRTKWLEVENVERVAGETKWSFWKLLVYAIDGIVAYSTAPLVLSTLMGAFFAMLAFVCLLIIIIRWLAFGDPVQGWASTVSIILFIGGVQMLCVGILGEYMAKTYTETKKRPIYVVGETNIH